MIREGLTFDDVLLVPQHSTVESRSKVDLSVTWGDLHYNHPIIPANMKTVTGLEMATKVIESTGLAILHRFMPIEEQIQAAKFLNDKFKNKHFAMSVGVKSSDREAVKRFMEVGVRMFCIDIAHGDSKHCLDMISWIKNNSMMGAFVIAGNVATGHGARLLWEAGADVVKVGVGPGSLCTTRIETGNGVPQLTALMDVAETQRQLRERERASKYPNEKQRTFPFIADGGIKSPGDVVKALCFADMVMVGNMFAGCAETPGQVLSIDGRSFKEYVGSSTHKTNRVEGVAAIVPIKGTFQSVLNKLIEGLQSGCSYQGAHNLAELRDNPEFIRITVAGLKESHPHDVILK
jgi:IMP dehydrogenase/GMP reductase